MSEQQFAFRDGERQIRFGRGLLLAAPELLAEAGFEEYTLLTTARALGDDPHGLGAGARKLAFAPPGAVPEIAAGVREQIGGADIVALGGGRVVDAAKAIAAADGGRVAAIPTTLAGSSFTPFHRMPAGVEGYGSTRAALALCDLDVMASAPMPGLAATAMNALAHAIESLYARGANPVAEGAAVRAIAAIAEGLRHDPPLKGSLSLGATLAGYAVGVAGLGIHHALCQTVVRLTGTPHAETNAVVLPHAVAFMTDRAPTPIAALAQALGAGARDQAGPAVAMLAALAGPRSLTELGFDVTRSDEVVAAAAQHPGAKATPGGVSRDDIAGLLEAAIGA